jgi:TonB family protein
MQDARRNIGSRPLHFLLTLACTSVLCTAAASPLAAQSALHTSPLPTAPTVTGKDTSGDERSCVSLMSNGLQSLQGKKVPLLIVRIGLDARLHDAALSRSSGDRALDKALLTCANGHPFMPITVNGQPAEVRWVVAYYVVPEIHEDGFLPASSNGKPRTCQNWPESAVRRNLNGDATYAYRIGTDGSTKDIKLTQSTGDADLDKATLDCVAAWKFFPALQNNNPIEIERTGRQHWRIQP